MSPRRRNRIPIWGRPRLMVAIALVELGLIVAVFVIVGVTS